MFTAYGAEVFGFLLKVLDDRRLADDVYGDLVSRVAAELDHVEGVELRVWLYGLARSALRERRKRQRFRDDLSTADTRDASAGALLPVVEAVRGGLSEDERELLILHVDRELDWNQLAIVELGRGASAPEVASEADRVSARFDKLLERIRELAQLELKKR